MHFLGDLAITDAALDHIREKRSSLVQSGDLTTCIAAICWVRQDLNTHFVLPSQPALGFYESREGITDDIVEIDGLEMLVTTTEEDRLLHLSGRTLDVIDGRLVVI